MISGSLTEIGLMLIGIGLLWKGADAVVVAACRIAHRFELSDAVIGATVVALGTSAPEVTVTLVAALGGQPDISVGNVLGSNIFNLGLILGGCAVLYQVPISQQLVKRDGLLLLGGTLLLMLFLDDNVLERYDGLAMTVCLGAYVLYLGTHG